ncbi:hypothetical protein [Halobaculum sp. P14]|uniref:hypothetical protein n=1 Tax=Halobaculum sp. P14 TaxID=3421638 RepID=UPI003EB848D3
MPRRRGPGATLPFVRHLSAPARRLLASVVAFAAPIAAGVGVHSVLASMRAVGDAPPIPPAAAGAATTVALFVAAAVFVRASPGGRAGDDPE